MEKVSVVIPTYNRFTYLLKTIDSIKNQTYKNIEIIVVNDRSTQPEYYTHNLNDITIIHLLKNTKDIFGFVCSSHVRNEGIRESSGKYIAFCDDDDVWLPNKLELQIKAMKENNCKMSCSEGFIGNGIYEKNAIYKKYNSEHYYEILKTKYKTHHNLENGFPEIWDKHFITIHNSIITSSVIIEKDILKTNKWKIMKNGGEDHQLWLRVLDHTSCAYVNEPCIYYDAKHGDGQNY
jgi:glycosyltransferase involved in cell wall biosynthesis